MASPDPVRRYLATVMVFPAVVVGILFCRIPSLDLKRKRQFCSLFGKAAAPSIAEHRGAGLLYKEALGATIPIQSCPPPSASLPAVS